MTRLFFSVTSTAIAISAALAIWAESAHAVGGDGNERGNGGDTVTCHGKMRFLDSVLTERGPFTIIRRPTADAALSRITMHLQITVPMLAKQLRTFIGAFETKQDLKAGLFWIAGLPVELNDENLYSELPAGCANRKQAVIRLLSPFKRFHYNPDSIAQLRANGDELSWLLVHEWQRDSIQITDALRLVNAFFHSEELLNMEEEETQRSLIALGINPGPIASALVRNSALLSLFADQLRSEFERVGARRGRSSPWVKRIVQQLDQIEDAGLSPDDLEKKRIARHFARLLMQ